VDFEKVIPERYRAKYDDLNDRWLVLDTWHPQIKNLPNLSEAIPEESPALKIITGTEMNAVLGEMMKIGHLDEIIKHQGKSGIIDNSMIEREERVLSAIERLINVFSGKNEKPNTKRKRDKTPILNG
jgi:hypothetical protein